MKILFVGDVFGSLGRNVLEEKMPMLKKQYKPDLIFVNAENIAHGKGINKASYDFLMTLGVDAMTLGNHTYDNQSILSFIDEVPNLARPANFPDNNPGTGVVYLTFQDKEIALVSIQGRTYMSPNDCPFVTMDQLLKQIRKKTPFIVVDFHAEASSEKIAMGYYLDGRVSAVVGTHTHVPTADNRILEHKTAYITDIGMTGPLEGVIGVQREPVISKFLTGMPARFNILETGPAQLNAVLIEIDEDTACATQITRINL